jgi:hypothetical protein
VVNNLNGAELYNETNAAVINYGTLHNDGTLANSATVDDYGTIDTPGGSGIYTQTAGLTTVEGGATFTQGTLSMYGGDFYDAGTVTISGAATNSGANLTINGVTMTVGGGYTQTGGSLFLANGGTLVDPPLVDVTGGTFGGNGTVDRDVTFSDSTLQVGDPTGQLQITGAYSQTGGEIVFDVFSDGHGGFVESTLEFTPGESVQIEGADIVFDFGAGADPSAFSTDGLFNIDTFFTDGSAFLSDFGDIFSGDTFQLEETGSSPTGLTLDPSNGNLAESSTSEPGTLFLLLPGLGLLGFTVYRRSRNG